MKRGKQGQVQGKPPANRAAGLRYAAMMGIVVTFELLRYGVAPHVTEVVEGANGLRDFASSCLLSR